MHLSLLKLFLNAFLVALLPHFILSYSDPMDQETYFVQLKLDLKKYHQAGLGFLVLNLLWFVLFYWFLPPFNLGLFAYMSATLYVMLVVVLARFLYKGARKLAFILAVIFGGRSIISIYTIVTGQAFMAVPFILPGNLLCFYLLGRAAWDWP